MPKNLFEIYSPGNLPPPDSVEVEPVYTGTSERHVLYPEPCENWVKIPEADPNDPSIVDGMGYCGGTVWDIGGNSYYNGNYQCYTLYLECENCGIYDVECV